MRSTICLDFIKVTLEIKRLLVTANTPFYLANYLPSVLKLLNLTYITTFLFFPNPSELTRNFWGIKLQDPKS